MSSAISDLIQRQHLFYQVSPYYVLDVEQPEGLRPIRRRVQAGFDVDLYATGAEKPLELTLGDQQLHSTLNDLEEVARELLPPPVDGSDVAIVPFEDSLVLDTHRNLRHEAVVRIRITHWRGLSEPEGPPEEEALFQIRKKLRQSGVPEGGANW